MESVEENARGAADAGPPDRALAVRVFREEASREGFARAGIARAGPPPHFDQFERWIAEGRHAGMRYLEETAALRASPEAILPGARSVVCLSAPHAAEPRVASDGSRLARYATGDDYHGTMRSRALRVAQAASRRLGADFGWRVCVDSTPIAERSFAAAAGLGWIGKNGCLIDPDHGSFLLLAEIVTDLDLPPDEPIAERCGSCVRCLDACPTSAFVSPGVLDASRCLSYWTIEHRGAIPDEIKPLIGDRVFGCDDCQDACPWNHPLLAPAGDAPTRAGWLEMGKGEWRRRWGASALNRAGRRGIQRNAAASAGATGDASCRAAVAEARGLSDRGLSDAAGWALPRFMPASAAAREDALG